MQRELAFTRAETGRAVDLAEAAGYVLDYVKRAPGFLTPRMPNRSEWIGFLAQARRELKAA